MITCVPSNNTNKSLGNHSNQDEQEQLNAAINNSSNDINHDNKANSASPNANTLSEKNKSNFTDHNQSNFNSLKSSSTFENEELTNSTQNDQDIPKVPQSLSKNFTSQSPNSTKISDNSIFPEITSYSKNFTKPVDNTSQNSEYSHTTHHKTIEEEDDSEPVLDSESDIGTLRSNSFRDIKSMVPRGYGKMGRVSLTKTDSEASIDFKKTTNSENDSESNTENSTNISQKTSQMLEEMRRRHAAAWRLLGYDPTHGKGDMRGSATLANFSPLKLIRQSKLFAQNGCSHPNSSNNNKNSVPKQVIQSYSLCIKPAYRTMKRVNSSNGPLSNLVDENCADPDEDDNQSPNSPFDNHQSKKKDNDSKGDFIPPSRMTTESLLNGPNVFKDEDSEEYLVVEEEEEEEFEEEEFEEEEESNDNDDSPNNEIIKQSSIENQTIDNSSTKPKDDSVEYRDGQNLTDIEKPTKK